MPEGDTVHRLARTLDRVLSGRVVKAVTSPLAAVAAGAERHRAVGSRITLVEARGKHLLVHFSCGATLHSHQRMHGSWHLYRAGSRWRRPAHEMRASIDAGDVTAVCFLSPVVEILATRDLGTHPALRHLGPDLLAPECDEPEACRRLRSRGALEVGVALLDQTALAGIGNVYKSEVLFLTRVDPFAKVQDLDDACLARLVRTAAAQMRRNLGAGPRRTTSPLSPSPLFAYGRSGKACRRCGRAIETSRQGEQGRTTYFCASCQGVVRNPSPS
jgi:endonuclease VIII